MSKRQLPIVLFVIAMLSAFPSSGTAGLIGTTPILPGATVVPGLVPAGTDPGTLLAGFDQVRQGGVGTPTAPFGTVFLNAGAVYMGPSGTLDFYFQLSNFGISATSIVSLTANILGPFNTTIGYLLDGSSIAYGNVNGPFFVDGSVAPSTADRSLSGNTVDFNFLLLPGMTSNLFVLSTDATFFDASVGEVFGNDWQVAVHALAPSTPPPPRVPDKGASAILLLLSLTSFYFVRRVWPVAVNSNA